MQQDCTEGDRHSADRVVTEAEGGFAGGLLQEGGLRYSPAANTALTSAHLALSQCLPHRRCATVSYKFPLYCRHAFRGLPCWARVGRNAWTLLHDLSNQTPSERCR